MFLTTYEQWRYYKLIEAAAREKAVSAQIIFGESFFKSYLEKFFQHEPNWNRKAESLEPYWPGITEAYRSYTFADKNIVTNLINVFKDRDEITRAMELEEIEKQKKFVVDVDTPRIVMDVKQGARRAVLSSDGILTMEYERVRRGVKQYMRTEHSSTILLDLLCEKCGGGLQEDQEDE